MYRRLLLGVLALLVAAEIASASVVVGDRLTYVGQTPGKSYGSGGEFTWDWTVNTGWPGPFAEGVTSPLYVFCAEVGQTVASPTYIVNLAATNSTGVYSLTDKAAWLIYREGNGGNPAVPTHATLTGTSAGAVQWAIWNEMVYAQQFANPDVALYNSWFTPSTGAYYTDTPWQTKPNPFSYYAQVAWLSTNYMDVPQDANNYIMNPGSAQDMAMFFASGELPDVPEPASVLVWCLLGAGSWLGMKVCRRRRVPVGRRPWSPENRTAILEIIECGARE